MNYGATSLYAWRGKEYRTIVKLPADKRGLEQIVQAQKTTRTTEDMPMWYTPRCVLFCCLNISTLRFIWNKGLVDYDTQKAKEDAAKTTNPEKSKGKGAPKSQKGKGKGLNVDFEEDKS